ncbi:MAG TPA: TIGR03435 family protein [Bryobacteraceae bacterium]|nr:TIGR03435 family protein [Bryobacteraceae bacterium]
MVRKSKLVFAIIAVPPLMAQPAARPQFEVASIRPSAQADRPAVNVGLHIDGSQVHCADWNLRDYIGMAYKIPATQVFGPDWTAANRFDISATFPAGSRESDFPAMFQTLLEDRFHLKTHKEKREFPVYALLPGKGPLKLKAAAPGPDDEKDEPKGTVNVAAAGSSAGVGVNLGHGSSYTLADNRFEAKKLSMSEFAGNLERFAGRPIIELTNIAGRYDFTIDLTPEDYRAMLIRAAISAGVQLPPQALRALDGSSEGALSDALQQIGLRLESRKAPLDVIVIDDASKNPTAN